MVLSINKKHMKSIITFFTQSSEDPAKTSATLTGILIAAASYIQQYADFIPVVHSFFTSPLGAQLDLICTSLGMIVGGIWCLFGLFRKFTNKIESSTGLAQ